MQYSQPVRTSAGTSESQPDPQGYLGTRVSASRAHHGLGGHHDCGSAEPDRPVHSCFIPDELSLTPHPRPTQTSVSCERRASRGWHRRAPPLLGKTLESLTGTSKPSQLAGAVLHIVCTSAAHLPCGDNQRTGACMYMAVNDDPQWYQTLFTVVSILFFGSVVFHRNINWLETSQHLSVATLTVAVFATSFIRAVQW